AHAQGDFVELDVHNEGPPIQDSVTPFLFDPFICDANRDLRKFESGIGLGLYTVREIVRAHGGEIAVVSSKDKGTMFTVRLPRDAKEKTARSTTSTAHPP